MTEITFKNKTYTVTENHKVPALLASDGLLSQMTVEGKRGAFYLLQIWQHELGGVYKMISSKGKLQVELK